MRANLFWFNDEQWSKIEPLVPMNRPAPEALRVEDWHCHLRTDHPPANNPEQSAFHLALLGLVRGAGLQCDEDGLRHDDGGTGVAAGADCRTDRRFRSADPLADADACPSWPIGKPASSFARSASHPGTTPRSRYPTQAGSRSPTRGPEKFFSSAIASGACLGCRGRALNARSFGYGAPVHAPASAQAIRRRADRRRSVQQAARRGVLRSVLPRHERQAARRWRQSGGAGRPTRKVRAPTTP